MTKRKRGLNVFDQIKLMIFAGSRGTTHQSTAAAATAYTGPGREQTRP